MWIGGVSDIDADGSASPLRPLRGKLAAGRKDTALLDGCRAH